jgi:hypothetical protein
MKLKIHIEISAHPKKNKKIDLIKFIPEEAKASWNDIEIFPIFESSDGYCEVVDEGRETFWSVYIHQVQGGVRCIADVPTKNDAKKLAELINILTVSRVR